MISNDQIKKDFKVLELNQRANDYIKNIIEENAVLVRKDVEYPQLFLPLILKQIDLSKGKILTCLPKDIAEADIYQFDYAKNYVEEFAKKMRKGFAVPVENTAEWLLPIFKKHLEAVDNAAIIFKHIYRLPTDAYFTQGKEKSKMLTTDYEMFFFLSRKDASVEKIRETLKRVGGAHPPMIAVCSTLSPQFNDGGKLTVTEIESIVNNIESIAVAAYDGDSYLVWTKQK